MEKYRIIPFLVTLNDKDVKNKEGKREGEYKGHIYHHDRHHVDCL